MISHQKVKPRNSSISLCFLVRIQGK